MFTIYKATNTVNGKVYIGQTVESLNDRIGGHITKVNNGSCYCFHNAIRKHGVDVFTWEAICFCSSKAEANKKESEFIIIFSSKVPTGYNMTDGGEGTLGCRPSKETRAKLSKAQKMFIQRTGKINFLGMKHTPESRAKITTAQLGKKRGPHSAKHKENIRAALQGRKLTEEQKLKISKSLTGIIVSEEARINISNAHKGLKHSDIAKENMKKAWLIRKQKSSSGHGYLKNGLPDFRGRIQL